MVGRGTLTFGIVGWMPLFRSAAVAFLYSPGGLSFFAICQIRFHLFLFVLFLFVSTVKHHASPHI